MNAKKLYLAGGVHHAWQRQYLEALAEKLAAHYAVFLPHRDGGRYVNLLRTMSMPEAARTIFNGDTAAIKASNLVLAVAFGKAFHDPGVCMEVGYATALGISCYGLAPDLDVSVAFNPMLRASFERIFTTWAELTPIINLATKGQL